jgi:glycosyltransferase involved in cell wall biosynthesis
LKQNFPASDREIVIVDDGSTDRTPRILQEFSKEAKILRKSNGGQTSAFNHGLANYSGEVIAFLDGDDFWCRAKLATVGSELEGRSGIGAVGHGILETDEAAAQYQFMLLSRLLKIISGQELRNWSFLRYEPVWVPAGSRPAAQRSKSSYRFRAI